MATIPNPPTFVAGAKLTAAQLNTNVRDAVNFFLTPPLCVLTSSVSQNVPNATQTVVLFDTEAIDDDSMFNAAANGSRVYANTPGWYSVSGTVQYAVNGTGDRFVSIVINGVNSPDIARVDLPANSIRPTALTTGTVIFLNAGDFVQLSTYQTSGGVLSTVANPRFTICWVHV